ncbi:CDP-alcohol phosphatidyltransferase family protein [Streptomyces sp. NPDC101225]|uniref:CDP-alcohol phosphatidyltransferase family protein n=1 Tax=Streptomyces sp. NPDC101225 TaxID=3366135 RepID=UPI0038155BE1
MSDLTDSRAATDALLGVLSQGRFKPSAVGRFLGMAAHRSLRQAAYRPRALIQVTVVHALLLAVSRDRAGRRWVTAAWCLAVLHLGLLEHRDRLSSADVLTLLRGNLPATALGSCRWSGVLALSSDLADGRLARRQGTCTPFGDYADSLADAAFWTWLVLRYEPSRTVRTAALAAWAAPVTAVTAVALRHGAMPERPRPALLRPAAALQAVVAARRLARR